MEDDDDDRIIIVHDNANVRRLDYKQVRWDEETRSTFPFKWRERVKLHGKFLGMSHNNNKKNYMCVTINKTMEQTSFNFFFLSCHENISPLKHIKNICKLINISFPCRPFFSFMLIFGAKCRIKKTVRVLQGMHLRRKKKNVLFNDAR